MADATRELEIAPGAPSGERPSARTTAVSTGLQLLNFGPVLILLLLVAVI